MLPKPLSRSYVSPQLQSTPALISITEIIFELKAIISNNYRQEYDIQVVNTFDEKTGMTLKDIFNLAVFSCVAYISPSRIVLASDRFRLMSSNQATLKYAIDVTDCKSAIEIAKIFNNPINHNTFNKFVEYSIQRQLSNNDVCSYSIIPTDYEIACCSWIHGYWTINTTSNTEALVWQDWKTCTFYIPQLTISGTINGAMVTLENDKNGEYYSGNNTIQWQDGTEWICKINKYPY